MPRKIKKKPYSHLAFILILAIGVTGVFFWFATKPAQSPTTKIDLPAPIPTPTINPKVGTLSQPSPDGKMILFSEISASESGALQYSFSVQKNESAEKDIIFSSPLNTEENITIPFNCWSPHNKYFFVETEDNFTKNYKVFNSGVKQFESGNYLDINQDFSDKNLPFRLTQVTGWASETLLIIRTEEHETGEKGPSFWYEIPTRNFIRLSSQF